MHKVISAADANRKFSQLLRDVRRGRSYVVTSHGKPLAKIVPVRETDAVASAAWTALLARLRSQPVVDIGRWIREQLYSLD
jgi:prevent-host-death family protein